MGQGGCSSAHCHGNGQRDGTSPVFTDPTDLTCGSCHPGAKADETQARYGTMSGRHEKHVWDKNKLCSDCHENVVDDNMNIIDASLHINGVTAATRRPRASATRWAATAPGAGEQQL